MTIAEALAGFTDRMEKNPQHIKDLSYVYEFHITDEENGVYQLHIDEGKAVYYEKAVEEPKLVMRMDKTHFLKLAHDDLNAAMAYMSGKLKIDGEISHALKFQSLIKKYQN